MTILGHSLRPPPKLSTTFAVDAMFYSAARKARERANIARKGVARANKEIFQRQERMDSIKQRAEDRNEDVPYAEWERYGITMESLEFSVVEAHGLVLRELAIAQIMSAQSLEAHINTRGKTLLTNREWEAFERMPLDAKWLFLPDELGKPRFTVGAEPFQSFDRLVKTRNQLVHYKVQKEPYHGFEDSDSLARKLGLTFEDVDRSIGAVKTMIWELAKQLGEARGPGWLESEGSHFFEIEEDKPKEGKRTATAL